MAGRLTKRSTELQTLPRSVAIQGRWEDTAVQAASRFWDHGCLEVVV